MKLMSLDWRFNQSRLFHPFKIHEARACTGSGGAVGFHFVRMLASIVLSARLVVALVTKLCLNTCHDSASYYLRTVEGGEL